MGHLDIVKFLYFNGYRWSYDTVLYVIKNNKISILQFLCSKGIAITIIHLYNCYDNHNNNILKFLKTLKCCEDIFHDITIQSISANNIYLFKFLQCDKYNISNIYLHIAIKDKKHNITKLNKFKRLKTPTIMIGDY